MASRYTPLIFAWVHTCVISLMQRSQRWRKYCIPEMSLPAFEIWLSMRPGQPKKSPDNHKYWCCCTTNNHKSVAENHLCTCIPSTDNQKRGQTTKNCNLVVRGTTIFFSLILTLVITKMLEVLTVHVQIFMCCFLLIEVHRPNRPIPNSECMQWLQSFSYTIIMLYLFLWMSVF